VKAPVKLVEPAKERVRVSRWMGDVPKVVLKGAARTFAESVVLGAGVEEAVRRGYGSALAAGQESRAVAEMFANPAVQEYLVKRLAAYDWSWVRLERTCRAVLSRALVGEESDGTPLGLSAGELERLRMDAAKTGLSALAKSAPETFVERARGEDTARLGNRELSVRLLGPVLTEGEGDDA
jgi:hypothetical protein